MTAFATVDLLATDGGGPAASRVAIEHQRHATTYGELATAAHGVRTTLEVAGVAAGHRVGVVADDRRLVVACLLGILELGAVFVPLDPAYPAKYLASLGDAADLHCVLAEDGATASGTIAAPTLVTSAHRLFDVAGRGDGGPIQAAHRPGDAAYIYFSSGTSGDPKPILGRLDGLLHFIRWEIAELGLEPGVRVGQLTSPGHDPYLRDVFVALLSGGTLCLPPDRNVLLSSHELRGWLDAARVQVLHCTPTILRALCSGSDAAGELASVEWVLSAGEQLHGSDVARWYERFGDRAGIVNLYGPTETTLAKLFHRVTRDDRARQAVPIGRPMPDTSVRVLLPDRSEASAGETGELHITTPFTSLGYFNRPELTERSFHPVPTAALGRPVTYRTGDVVKVLADGDLEFVARRDRQVKIAGVRVEPEGVERAVLACAGVTGCVVAPQARDHHSPPDRLIAYYSGERAPSPVEVKRHLAERLPAAMVPGELVHRPQLPVTVNGKLDRRELVGEASRPAPAEAGDQPSDDSVTEELLVMWQEILGHDGLGADDVFMDYGDSLSVMVLIDRVADTFDYELPLVDVFDDLTVERLREAIEKDRDAAG